MLCYCQTQDHRLPLASAGRSLQRLGRERDRSPFAPLARDNATHGLKTEEMETNEGCDTSSTTALVRTHRFAERSQFMERRQPPQIVERQIEVAQRRRAAHFPRQRRQTVARDDEPVERRQRADGGGERREQIV